MSDEKEVQPFAIGSFSLVSSLPREFGGQMTFAGQVLSTDTTETLNARLDWFQDLAKRQLERVGLELRNAERAKHVQNLERLREIYANLKAKKDAGLKLTTTDKNQFDNFDATQKMALEQIQLIEDGIEAAKKKYGI